MGEGIDRNIKQLYSFLVLNYQAGDEIYLFGYSRGAYTVRSLAGMLDVCGLVRGADLEFVHEAYEVYRNKLGKDHEEVVTFRSQHCEDVPVKLVACFDTVGSLGLPYDNLGFIGKLSKERYAFHSTTLSQSVENGIHMMSIDEDRMSKFFFPWRIELHRKESYLDSFA